MKECEKCLHSRPIVSENGIHSVCCLSQKSAINCMMGKKNHFAALGKNANENIKVKF